MSAHSLLDLPVLDLSGWIVSADGPFTGEDGEEYQFFLYTALGEQVLFPGLKYRQPGDVSRALYMFVQELARYRDVFAVSMIQGGGDLNRAVFEWLSKGSATEVSRSA